MQQGQVIDRSGRVGGALEPRGEAARQAVRAIGKGDLIDAAKSIAAMPASNPLDQAWKRFLDGTLCMEQRRGEQALTLFHQACSHAVIETFQSADAPPDEAVRLAGMALIRAGTIARRLERVEEATRTHRAAWNWFDRFGSDDDRWELCNELAIDAHMASALDEADAWFAQALDATTDAGRDGEKRKAVTWGHIVTLRRTQRRHADAVQAARQALIHWRAFDPGVVDVPQAEARLAGALLQQAIAEQDCEGSAYQDMLAECVQFFRSAQDALAAFGPAFATDGQWIADQQVVAERLQAG